MKSTCAIRNNISKNNDTAPSDENGAKLSTLDLAIARAPFGAVFHLSSGACQPWIGFRTFFETARLTPIWAVGQQVFSDDLKHPQHQPSPPFAVRARHAQDGLAVMA